MELTGGLMGWSVSKCSLEGRWMLEERERLQLSHAYVITYFNAVSMASIMHSCCVKSQFND